MEINRTIEIVQCLNCNSLVPKRLYCRKCGKVLLASTMKEVPETIIENEKNNKISSTDLAFRSPYEQLKSIRVEKEIEKYETVNVKSRHQFDETLSNQNITVSAYREEKNSSTLNSIVGKETKIAIENDPESYMPDLYVKEIVDKINKSLKYEVNLVQLLQEGQITEEHFTRLFNDLVDETTNLNSRRTQSINEIINLLKRYESTVLSAQQGMKLLDLRKSIGDASEEEVIIKSSALNWDINYYGNRIIEGRKKSSYLKNLGKLIPEEELEKLASMAIKFSNDINPIIVSPDTRDRIIKAMQEASSILSEASVNSISQCF